MRNPSLVWPGALTPRPKSAERWLEVDRLSPLSIDRQRVDWMVTIPALTWSAAMQASMYPRAPLVSVAPMLDAREVRGQRVDWIRNPGLAWPASLQPMRTEGEAPRASWWDEQDGAPRIDWISRTFPSGFSPAFTPALARAADLMRLSADWRDLRSPTGQIVVRGADVLGAGGPPAGDPWRSTSTISQDRPQAGWVRTPSLAWPIALTPFPGAAETTPAPGSVLDVRGVTSQWGGWLLYLPPPVPVAQTMPAVLQATRARVWDAASLDVTAVDRPQFGWVRNPSLIWPAALAAAMIRSVVDVWRVSLGTVQDALLPAWLAATLPTGPSVAQVLPALLQARLDAERAVGLDVRQVDRGQFGWVRNPTLAWPASLFPSMLQARRDSWPGDLLDVRGITGQLAPFAMQRVLAQWLGALAQASRARVWDVPGLAVSGVDRPQFGWARSPALTWPAFLQPGIRPGGLTVPMGPVFDVRTIPGQVALWAGALDLSVLMIPILLVTTVTTAYPQGADLIVVRAGVGALDAVYPQGADLAILGDFT